MTCIGSLFHISYYMHGLWEGEIQTNKQGDIGERGVFGLCVHITIALSLIDSDAPPFFIFEDPTERYAALTGGLRAWVGKGGLCCIAR